MIDFTPDPVLIQIGPLPVYWYGIGYAVGLLAAGWIATREARWRGLDPVHIPNAMIAIAIAALVGGRLYHVVDQWQLYRDDLLRIVLPPYTGLGAYGGLVTGLVALVLYTRHYRMPFWRWADVAAPAVLVMQAIGRWGNFFNQELYGPPTNLPWAIAIECQHRIAQFACPPVGSTPVDAHFHPLFLYESVLSIVGAAGLIFIARRFAHRLRPGDIAMGFFIWQGGIRFVLETFRTGWNWTFFGIPTAQIFAAGFIVGAIAVLIYRHRRGTGDAEPTVTAGAADETDGTEPDRPPATA